MRLLAKEETPLDWTSKKIGSYVLGHKGGAALRPSDFSDVGFPVIPKKAIQPTGELLIESPTYCTNEFASNNKRSIVDNSYTITTLRDLVPTGPTIGTVVNFTSEEKYILSQGIYGLKLNDDLDKKYLSYLSNTSFYRKVMQRIMVGSTQVHIRTPEYLDLEIQIPPLPEQQKISNILSTWDKAISTTERLIENSTQQKKALMQQLLTGKKRLLDDNGERFAGEWEEVKLEDITIVNPKKPSQPEDSFVSFIPMEAVSENAKLIKQEIRKYEDVSKGFTAFMNQDVVVAKITPCFENGKGAFVDDLRNGIGFGSTEFHVLRAKRQNHPRFIYYLSLTNDFRGRGQLNMQGSAGHKRVTTDYVKLYKFLVPPTYKEQQKVATVLTNADKEIELLEQQLADLQQEKKALMQVLLTGKRRVVVDGEAI